jgi:hypothetical protein
LTAVLLCAGCAEGGTGGPGGGGGDAGPGGPRDSGRRVDAFVPRFDSGIPIGGDAGRDSGIRPRDAGRTPDAGVRRDAGGIPGFDSGGMMMGFCTSTAECASMPGTCCFLFPPDAPMGFCVPGMEMFGVCFPSE